MPDRPRILVDVRPALLQDAIAHLLVDADIGEVVAGGDRTDEDRFEVAVVTVELPGDTDADVVFALPDQFGSSGDAVVSTATDQATAHLDDVADLISLVHDSLRGPEGPTGR